MARRMRALDWSRTALPDPESWPATLRAALAVCLTSRFPMHVWWGPALTLFYNDACIPLLGPGRHPAALGRSGRDVWEGMWDTFGPIVARVLPRGEATWSEDVPMFLDRHVRQEEVYVSFSASPILGGGGWPEGMFCTATETTARVVGQRRTATLRQLGADTHTARSAMDACLSAGAVLRANPRDLPFAGIYLWDDAARQARLCVSTCDASAPWQPPPIVRVGDPGWASWPLAESLSTRRAADVSLVSARVTAGPWAEPIRQAIVQPIRPAAHDVPAAFLVAGISPRRPLDDAYRTFVELAAGQIAGAIAGACANELARRRGSTELTLRRMNEQLESGVVERTQALRESEARLAHELVALRHVQAASAELIVETDEHAIYQRILDAAIAILQSDFGSMQIYDADADVLRILASRNFTPEGLARWAVVRRDTGTACGLALASGAREIVEDVAACDIIRRGEHWDGFEAVGIRSVQSTPLRTRTGTFVGMLSTHWRRPHRPSETELDLIDLLARQAADLIERNRAEALLRASENGQALLVDFGDACRGLSDPLEIEGTASRLLGEHLGVTRVVFAEIEGDDAVIRRSYARGVAPMDYRTPYRAYGALLAEAYHRGEPVCVADVTADARLADAERAMLLSVDIAAFCAATVLYQGRWVAVMSAHNATPRAWTEAEIRLVRNFAERVWPAIERARAEAALRQANDGLERRVQERTAQLEALFRRLVTVQEEERRRLARDIHDQLGQHMTALRMHLDALAGAGATAARRIAAELDQSIDYLTMELRPAALDHLGLSGALVHLVTRWSEQFGIPAEFEAVDASGLRFEGDVEANLYRLAQEALHNVAKHAGAHRVSVVLGRRDGQVVLVIEDDGRGFDPGEAGGRAGAGSGLGLVSMRERAALAGGDLEIESAPGRGTTIYVRVPAPPTTAARAARSLGGHAG